MSTDIDLGQLEDELRHIAENEINETPETRAAEIQTLRKRVLLHPELQINTDGAYLLRFLRAAAFDQEAAFTLIMKYFEMKASEKNKHLFANMRPSAVKHILEAGVTGELPTRDKLGRRVMVFRPGCWDASKHDMSDVFKSNFMTLFKFVEDEETQIKGTVVLFDMKGLGFGHLTHLSPFLAKRIAHILQESFPMRFKALHFVDEPAVFDIFFAIIKGFLRQETIDKMFLHGHDMKSLGKYFDIEKLPSDFGGKAPPYSNKEWAKTLLNCDAEFDAEAKNGLVKGAGKGGSGSYRKLDA